MAGWRASSSRQIALIGACVALAVCVCVWSYGDPILQEGVFAIGCALNAWAHIGYVGPEKGYNRGIVERENDIDGDAATSHRDLLKLLSELFADERKRLGRDVLAYEFGCGRGGLAKELDANPGVSVVGVDGYRGIRTLGANYASHNLSEPFSYDADWAISIEVGEHVPAERTFLTTLMEAKRGIVLSWARPGQGGHGHINERSPSYLQRRIERLSDFAYCPSIAHALSNGQTSRRRVVNQMVRANILVFMRGLSDEDFAQLCADRSFRGFVDEHWGLFLFAASGSLVLASMCWRSLLSGKSTRAEVHDGGHRV